MKEKIVELLVHIMTEIRGNATLNDIDLGDLKNKGYTQTEIGEALSWLHENLHMENGVAISGGQASGRSTRVFHELEKSSMTIEAQGYLMQLRELGLLDARDLETVIERVMLSGYEKLTVSEVREAVASVLFGKSGRSHGSLPNGGESIH